MKKQYLLLAILSLFCSVGFSQDLQVIDHPTEIENLSIFPNPASQGKVYITSKNNLPKFIKIFNVLGKSILSVSINRKELDISNLKAGIYIIKVTEGEKTTTRKLIIR